ncbi:MAG: iron ABC transporter permease [Candidatus Omnitrophota bacterium]
MRQKAGPKIALLFCLLCAAILLGIWKGAVNIPIAEIASEKYRIILYIRLARIAISILAGAGLGVCGVALQAILKNPLAEPYLLGTSSGAGLGAVVGIILGISSAFLPLAAFIGAILSIVIVYNIALENGRIPAQSLILSGVIVAVSLSGVMVFLASVFSNKVMHGIVWWLLGSLQVYDLKLLLVVGSIVVIGIASVFFLAQDLNAISLGEEEATHLGVNIEAIKKILFFICSLIIGSLVSITGIIGFVGLIIPHMLRLVVGPNHKVLIPATCFGAAAFLVLCDTFSRSLMPPIEIPIGVITSLVGAPVFIILLKRKKRIG